jgi:flagellin
MTSINTNTASSLAANALMKNERAMDVAMERLSTGLRINSAKDDSAGLAIATKMNAQISGLKQASRNANDGISMLQTFEGASGEITSLLNRMRDLVIQGQNDTYTDADRANLGEEYNALKSEITRIVDNTQWNTKAHMKTGADVSLAIGANAGQNMNISISNWSTAVSQNIALSANQNGNGTNQIETQTINFDPITLAVGDSIAINYKNKEFVYTNTTSASITDAVLATAVKNAITNLGPFSGTVAGNTVVYSAAAADFTNYDAMVVTHINSSSGVTVRDWSGATTKEIDRALSNASTEQAKYGSYISRLEKSSDNLLNVAMNTDASRAQIEDADYAAETTELAKTQIIAQAGTAMLAQANQIKNIVLALLK